MKNTANSARSNRLQREAREIMTQNIFVMCPSTDMERLASFYAANKRLKYRPLVSRLDSNDIALIYSMYKE